MIFASLAPAVCTMHNSANTFTLTQLAVELLIYACSSTQLTSFPLEELPSYKWVRKPVNADCAEFSWVLFLPCFLSLVYLTASCLGRTAPTSVNRSCLQKRRGLLAQHALGPIYSSNSRIKQINKNRK